MNRYHKRNSTKAFFIFLVFLINYIVSESDCSYLYCAIIMIFVLQFLDHHTHFLRIRVPIKFSERGCFVFFTKMYCLNVILVELMRRQVQHVPRGFRLYLPKTMLGTVVQGCFPSIQEIHHSYSLALSQWFGKRLPGVEFKVYDPQRQLKRATYTSLTPLELVVFGSSSCAICLRLNWGRFSLLSLLGILEGNAKYYIECISSMNR